MLLRPSSKESFDPGNGKASDVFTDLPKADKADEREGFSEAISTARSAAGPVLLIC